MSKEMVIKLRRADGNYIGPRWVVTEMRYGGFWSWLRSLFTKRVQGWDSERTDHSTESCAPSIGVAITWKQYNILADKLGVVWNGDLRPLFFVPPPPKHKQLEVEL